MLLIDYPIMYIRAIIIFTLQSIFSWKCTNMPYNFFFLF